MTRTSSRTSPCATGHLFSAGRCLIDKPGQPTNWSNACCWHLAVAGADRAKDLCLFFARHQKSDAPAALDDRIGHGDADLRPAMRDGGYPALAFIQHGLSR